MVSTYAADKEKVVTPLADQPEPGTLLGSLLAQGGVSYREFSDEYRRIGKQLFDERRDSAFRGATVATKTWKRWRSGVTGLPRHPAPRILERMYPTYSVQALFGPPDAIAVNPTSMSTLDDSDLMMTARKAAVHAGNAAASNLPDMTISQLEDDAIEFVRAYVSKPPFTVYGQGNELLAVAQAMLDRTQIVSQRSRLYLVAGEVTAILSAAAFDLGSLTAATSFARSAAMYGQVIEHGPLQAYAHGTLALLAYWDRRPSDAVRLIVTAKTFTGLGDTGQRRLGAIEARAYGHLGDAANARRAALDALEFDSGSRDELHDDVGGEFSFSRRRTLMSNGTTHLLLGDGPSAEEATGQAIALMASRPGGKPALLPQEHTDLAQAQTDLARARILAGEFDGAAEAIAPVFDLPREWRVAGVTDRLRGLRQDLTRVAVPGPPTAKAELAEHIDDYVAVGAHSQLGSTLALGS